MIPTLFAEIKSKDLPADLIAAAQQCFEQGEHRLALAYLPSYSELGSAASLSAPASLMTERECKRAIDARCQIKASDICPLIFSWSVVAWGHKTPRSIL